MCSNTISRLVRSQLATNKSSKSRLTSGGAEYVADFAVRRFERCCQLDRSEISGWWSGVPTKKNGSAAALGFGSGLVVKETMCVLRSSRGYAMAFGMCDRTTLTTQTAISPLGIWTKRCKPDFLEPCAWAVYGIGTLRDVSPNSRHVPRYRYPHTLQSRATAHRSPPCPLPLMLGITPRGSG